MDLFWLPIAFFFGFLARQVGLPPLVGFLVAGFVLNAIGVEGDAVIDKVGDFGVMLLLFAIGLKLKVKGLARAEVWAGATLQMSITVVVFSVIFYGLALANRGVPAMHKRLMAFAGLSLMLPAFARVMYVLGLDGIAALPVWLAFIFAIPIYDVLSARKIYAATWIGLALNSAWITILLTRLPTP